MSASVIPLKYHSEVANRVPRPAAVQFLPSDSDYGANSASNTAPTFVAYSSVTPRAKMSDPTREEIQAQIAASEARGDTRVARLEGKIDTLAATLVGKIDTLQSDLHKSDSYNRDSRLITIATIVASALALGGLIATMATYGDAMFGRGMNVRDVVQTVLKETATQPAPKNAK
jgi:hypothetical protein